jgi:hypothetical protein
METIIKLAIEGGWKPREFIKNYVLNIGHRNFIFDSPFDDPLFWQALGKSCGWEGGYEGEIKWWKNNQIISTQFISQEPCVYIASRFYEINITEGWDKSVAYLLSITSK